MKRFVLRRVLPYVTLMLMFVLAFFRLQGIKQVTDATRAINKRIGNPVIMKLAGGRYFFAGTIHHTGRHSCMGGAHPRWVPHIAALRGGR